MEVLTARVPAIVASPRFTLSSAFAAVSGLTHRDVGAPDQISGDLWRMPLYVDPEGTVELDLYFRVTPVYATGILDGDIGGRHVTREVKVVSDVELTLLQVVIRECGRYDSLNQEQANRAQENWPELLEQLVCRKALISHF